MRMKGLELARKCYEQFGENMIRECFPKYISGIAVGLAGEGSECFGYDDEISQDHDFGPDFCLWLPDEIFDEIGAELSKAYEAMMLSVPWERNRQVSAGGANRRGVKRIRDFYTMFTGKGTGPESWQEWMRVPDHLLACAVNGEIFRDDLGEFGKIRNHILTEQPEDVRKKKIAAKAVKMAQSGQYNFSRCAKREETGAAVLALNEFVVTTVQMVYLLNKAYSPYYKWMFRGLRDQNKLSELADPLEHLLIVSNEKEDLRRKAEEIESICSIVIRELKNQELTDGDWDYMEPHAFCIMKKIENEEIRRLHIMAGG